MGNKHIQMPHQLGSLNKNIKLVPIDKLIYVYMRSHANADGKTFVSSETLSAECGINRKTISKSIARLLEANEIFIEEDKSGRRCKIYKFNKDSRHFEIFSQECLDFLKKENYTTNEKCVLICLHEFSYKTKNYGELHGNLDEIAQNISMPISTFKRTMKLLSDKGIINCTHNKDNHHVRRIQWDKIMMQMIYQVKENTEDIKNLKKDFQEQRNMIKELQDTLECIIKAKDELQKKLDMCINK